MNAITIPQEQTAVAQAINLGLFYDTETSGLPLWNQPSEDPGQPHIVQLAAKLIDLDSKAVLGFMDTIIKPDGWIIPDEVAAVHGITTERAMDEGIPEAEAVEQFLALWGNHLRIAHNEQFDARILRIALMRFMADRTDEASGLLLPDHWKAGRAECTARMATKPCALPPTEKMRAARRFHNKTPNLSEAYKFFTGQELQNAHSAMADVDGCIAVYFGAKDWVAA
jgi:DNA polymerase-3 subunit epsilon